jgi:hypothetical protein
MHYRLGRLCWLICGSAGLLLAADASWQTKPPAQWSEEDARQVLIKSPWSMEIGARIAPRQTEDELRAGGQMGQPKGVGYDGLDPKGSGPQLPKNIPDLLFGKEKPSARSQVRGLPLRLRWESALPVQLAELKAQELDPPTLEGEGYRIAIYDIPGGYLKGDPKKLGDPLKEYAFIKREGKKDAKPSRAEVFTRADGAVVVYLFPLSTEISPKDGQIQFEAHIGRIVVNQIFPLAAMMFQGKLEL